MIMIFFFLDVQENCRTTHNGKISGSQDQGSREEKARQMWRPKTCAGEPG